MLAEAGLRCESEVLWLSWDDVRLDDGFLWIGQRDGHRTESGEGRWVPMTPRRIEAMRTHCRRFRFASYDCKATPWVFHHDTTTRTYTAGERIKSLRGSFRGTAERAKLPDVFRPHDLRHRRATTLAGGGEVGGAGG